MSDPKNTTSKQTVVKGAVDSVASESDNRTGQNADDQQGAIQVDVDPTRYGDWVKAGRAIDF